MGVSTINHVLVRRIADHFLLLGGDAFNGGMGQESALLTGDDVGLYLLVP